MYNYHTISLYLTSLLNLAATLNMSHYANMEDSTEISSEKLLIQHLLRAYDRVGRNGRPVIDINTTVPVQFGLGLIQMDLDEKNKVLTISAWTKYWWKDRYLMWKPELYEGINTIRLDPALVWVPDITLYNTADVDVPTGSAQVLITYDGTVNWYPHTIFRSSCSIDVSNFPFDYQQCAMWFGSWTYSSKDLDLTMAFAGGIDLTTFETDYKETCGWTIINITSERKVLPSEEIQPNFIVLTFDIFMKRKLVFSSYILTLPCVFLACITLVVFWLPPERPDRTSLAMSSFSSFMVLLLILVEACPATASSVPTLGIYYCFNMVIIMLSIILSSMVVNLSRGATYGVPGWTRVLVGSCIGRIIFLYSKAPNTWKVQRKTRKGKKNDGDQAEMNPIHDSSIQESNNYEHMVFRNHLCAHCGTQQQQQQLNGSSSGTAPPTCLAARACSVTDVETQITEMRKTIQRIEMKMDVDLKRKAHLRDVAAEWRYIALVLDRLFFCIYVALITISLSVLFPRTF